jgi:hypothetical protein
MRKWIGILALVGMTLATTALAEQQQVRPYPFLRAKPSRHHLGLTLGMPQLISLRYEYHLAHSIDGFPSSMLGIEGMIAPTGIGIAYRGRFPQTRLYMALGYSFISLPRGLIDTEVDLGARVRHAGLASLELRLGNPSNDRMWVVGGGIWLDIDPEVHITLRPMVTLGVVHRLEGGED